MLAAGAGARWRRAEHVAWRRADQQRAARGELAGDSGWSGREERQRERGRERHQQRSERGRRTDACEREQ